MSDLILPPGVEIAATGGADVFPPGAPLSGSGMIVNETDLPDQLVETYIEEHASVLGLSPGNTYATYIAQGSLLTRPKFRVPTSTMEEIVLARDLAERDDDVAATIGAMQALAFGEGMQNAHEDEIVVAMFDQIARKSKLLGRFKEMYREYLIAAQCTIATVMVREAVSFTPMGADRQRTRQVLTPRIAVIPAEQIRVLGNDLFGTGQLAYRPFSGRQENWLIEYFGQATTAARKAEMRREDPILTTLLVEMVAYDNQKDGGSTWVYGDPMDPVIGHYIWLMDPALVQRVCMPKGQWAHPRPLLARNFPLLEAKRLLSIMDYCVDLETEILTERGWLHHDEVRVGDRTLGYNPESKRNEWTPITGLHHTEAELLEVGNSYWSARCTPNHRWYASWPSWNWDGRWQEGFVATKEFTPGSRKRLLLTAPAVGGDSPLSPEEAAMIAWIICDGNVYEHDSGAWTAHVYQAKPAGIEALELTLAGMPHRQYVKKAATATTAEVRTYAILGSYVKGLFNRAGLDRDLDGLPDLMVRLSVEARRSFLKACYDAEGWMNGSTPCIAQNPGPVLQSIVLCAHLCGERPTVRGGANGCKVVSLNVRKTVKVDKLRKRSLGIQPVWCVQTGLGTWTMRQGDTISITGNCLLEAGANFLVVAKKGSDARPALPEEIANLRDTLKRATRSGVMIGDHRLDIEIITPKLDELLNPAKRKLLGRKLANAILRLPDFQSGDGGSGQSVLTDTEIISRVVTSDRDDLKLLVEDAVYQMIADRNGDSLIGPAKIWFPKIILQGLQYFTQLVLGLRDRGDIPRKYAVEAAGFSYTAAVQQRRLEKASGDDKVLTPPPVPFSTPNAGADMGFIPGRGGRPTGSGPDNGAPGARPSSQPAKPPGSSNNAPRSEEVHAILDDDTDRVVRVGSSTYAVLESYLDTKQIGRLNRMETAALREIAANPMCGIVESGAFIVVPVNPDYELEEISAVRLEQGGPSMLVGRRVDDRALVARALVFREPQYNKLDAEETALRWGFEVARPVDDG